MSFRLSVPPAVAHPFRRALLLRTLLALLVTMTPAIVYAQAATAPSPASPSPDSAAVAAAITAFHRALRAGDTAAVMALLAPDVVILESGDVESRAEYRAHHLAADVEFARAVGGVRTSPSVKVAGDAAWATATSVTTGTFRGRAINSAGAELMVLTRGEDGQWRIRAIHWSSHTRRGSGGR